MPHKTSRPNNDQVANNDQGSYSSNTAGSAKHSHLLANSDQGSSTSKTGGSNKDLAKLQSCISKRQQKGPDGLSRSIVDICYDQTFYGNFNNQASNTGSNSDNQTSNTGSNSDNQDFKYRSNQITKLQIQVNYLILNIRK